MPRVQQKRGTASALASVNPTPLAGELVWDSTENAIKIGDGSTAWTSLAYVTATPRSHTHSADAITSGTVAYARLPVGSTASTVCAGDDSRLSDSRTPNSHSHGNISNVGAIGTTSNLPVITGTSGVLQAGAFGTAANTFCQGNDSRLSDTRTPTDGSVTTAKIVDANVTYAKLQNVSATDRLLGRSSAGAGNVEEITCTAFGRSLIDDADAAAGLTTLGAAPAASPTFTGTATFGGVILADDSTSLTAPVYSFTGDENCGIARPAADTLSLVTDQTQRIRVRSDGNVGVGYDGAVNHRLGISGNISATGANVVFYAFGTAQSAATSVYGQWAQVGAAAGTTLSLLYNFYAAQGTFTGTVATQAGFVVESTLVGATNNFGFRGRIPSGTGRWNLYMDGTADNFLAGNTGIGIAAPSSALHVNGVITVAATSGSAGTYLPSVCISGDNNTGFGQVSGQSDTASIFTAGHERVRARANGRLDVGPPTGWSGGLAPFNVAGDNDSLYGTVLLFDSRAAAVGVGGSITFAGKYQAADNGARYAAIAGVKASSTLGEFTGAITFSTNGGAGPLERMRVDPFGNLGLGTTSPTAAMDINADRLRLRLPRTPASASAAGNAGDICWDASYLYVCTATNTWRRIAHDTW